jgi:hypothetical protein
MIISIYIQLGEPNHKRENGLSFFWGYPQIARITRIKNGNAAFLWTV